MGSLGSTGLIRGVLSAMVADHTSSLAHDERVATLCWLQGLPTPVLLLVPDDLLPQILAYVQERHRDTLAALADDVGAHPSLTDWSTHPAAQMDSRYEIDFFLTWQEEALDLVYPLTPQFPMFGGKYRLDFAFAPLRVGIELDSYTYHSDRETFTRDRQRQREIEAQGWRIIRFSGDELCNDVVRCVQEAAYFLSLQQYRQRNTGEHQCR